MKVCVCGAAGGIGQPLSLLLKQSLRNGDILSLYDVINTPGVALDLSHICTPVKVESYLGDMKNPRNPEVYKALKDSDIVVIPAGVPRKPGMSRDDLFAVNAGIVRDLIEACAISCPKALISIITNPVNSIVPLAAEILKKHGIYDERRLFGVSTLDVVRAQTFVGECKNIDPSSVKIDVVGGHSPQTMVPLLSKVPGVVFSDEEIHALVTRIRDAGTVVVEAKGGAGSATLSMAFSGARFVMALIAGLRGTNGIVECAYVPVPATTNISSAWNRWIELCGSSFLAVPVELGIQGVERILEPPDNLSDYEREMLALAMPTLNENIQEGLKFVRG